jgi:hypothetical protein
MFIDDDDQYELNALTDIRNRVLQHPGKILIFKMRHAGEILWTKPQLTLGNVSTQMFVVPNVPAQLGVWPPGVYAGDYAFLRQCVNRHPKRDAGVVWCPELVATHGISSKHEAATSPASAAPARQRDAAPLGWLPWV